jgi:hypothetical protein
MTITASIRTESEHGPTVTQRLFDDLPTAESFADNALGQTTTTGVVVLVSLFDTNTLNTIDYELERGNQ